MSETPKEVAERYAEEKTTTIFRLLNTTYLTAGKEATRYLLACAYEDGWNAALSGDFDMENEHG